MFSPTSDLHDFIVLLRHLYAEHKQKLNVIILTSPIKTHEEFVRLQSRWSAFDEADRAIDLIINQMKIDKEEE